MRGTRAIRAAGSLLAVGIALHFSAQSSKAATLEAMFGDINSTFLFDQSAGAQGEISVPSATVGSPAATSVGGPGPVNLYSLSGLSVVWTGSPLTSDNNPGGPLASGTFGAGGTFSISGTAMDLDTFASHTGLLLEGVVGSFDIIEQVQAGNFVDVTSTTFTPTGGALFDGTVGTAFPVYEMGLTGVEVMQGGADLDDFQSDVQLVDVLAFALVQIPEPNTALMLGALAIAALRRRQS